MASSSIIDRLAQLQNLIKRDPEAYLDEFNSQHKNFTAELEILRLHPTADSESFRQLVTFLSHVSTCYKKELEAFPQQLVALLTDCASALDSEVRRTVAQALMLLRNRGVVQPVPMLKVCFGLFRVQDKYLRELVFSHIVNDIKNINTNRNDGTTNRQMQTYMYGMLNDDSPVAAKRSLDVLIELYRRQIWTDARTVNVIAQALLSPRTKLLVTALKFFLGVGSGEGLGGEDDEESDSDDDDKNGKSMQLDAKAVVAIKNENAHVKKTRKRVRATAKHLAAMRKAKKNGHKGTGPVFPAIQLINDPQGLGDKMFNMHLRKGGERFEVRLMALNFVTRLVGQHKLMMLPLYSYLQRYLQAHQANVTQLLAYLIQSVHDLVPPDELGPVVKSICSSFISDGCAPEVIQVGLNSLREIFMRCPVVLEEEGMADLIQDLAMYKKFKNKGVVASARSIVNLVREWYPSLLKRKDWGKDLSTDTSKQQMRPTAYGAVSIATGVDGADLLALALARKAQKIAASKAAAAAAAAEFDEEEDGDSDDEGDDEELDDEEEEQMAADDAAAAAATADIGEVDIAAVADSDEWAKVERRRLRDALKSGKGKAKMLALQQKTKASASGASTSLSSSSSAAPIVVRKGIKGLHTTHNVPTATSAAGGANAAAAAAAGGDAGDGDKVDGAEDDAAELADFLLASDSDDDDEHDHDHGHHHVHHEGCAHDHGDDEDEDDEEEDEEEDDEDDGAVQQRKRARRDVDAEDEDEEEEDEDEDDEMEDDDEGEEDEEDDQASHSHSHAASSSVGASLPSRHTGSRSAASTLASQRAALAAAAAPLMAGKKKAAAAGVASATSSSSAAASKSQLLEASRILTPKDFARIRAIQAKLAEKGLDGASAKDILRILRGDKGEKDKNSKTGDKGSVKSGSGVSLSSSSAGAGASAADGADATSRKRKRGGRGLGVVDDDGKVITESEAYGGGSDDSDSEREDQLAIPGTSYAPAVISVDSMAIEANETTARRKQAERLVDVLKVKKDGKLYEGRKKGGGTTNKEKGRKKNFLMLRKSSGVAGKLKASLRMQQKNIKERLNANQKRDKRQNMKRRRT